MRDATIAAVLATADDGFLDELRHGGPDALRSLVCDLISGYRAVRPFDCSGCGTQVCVGEMTQVDARRPKRIMVCGPCGASIDRSGYTIGELSRGDAETEPNMSRIERR
jgi:hypothetical protein